MTIRAFRFQADADPVTGLFVTGQIFDQVASVDPVTDKPTAGALIGPTDVTSKTHPEIFACLNELADCCAERVKIKRAAYLASEGASNAK